MKIFKGQSAIEYLTSYGWMLLVIVIAGSAIFTTVQDSSNNTDVTGFNEGSVKLDQAGIKEGHIEFNLDKRSSDNLKISKIRLEDKKTGKYISKTFTEDTEIGIKSDKVFEISGINSSESENTLDIEVIYDEGELKDQVGKGNVRGKITINENQNITGGLKSQSIQNTNTNPVASFELNNSDPKTNETILFNATNSTDPDGTITKYEWDWQNDGLYEASGKTANHSYQNTGNKTVNLRITDNESSKTTENTTINVRETFADKATAEYFVEGTNTNTELVDFSTTTYDKLVISHGYQGDDNYIEGTLKELKVNDQIINYSGLSETDPDNVFTNIQENSIDYSANDLDADASLTKQLPQDNISKVSFNFTIDNTDGGNAGGVSVTLRDQETNRAITFGSRWYDGGNAPAIPSYTDEVTNYENPNFDRTALPKSFTVKYDFTN